MNGIQDGSKGSAHIYRLKWWLGLNYFCGLFFILVIVLLLVSLIFPLIKYFYTEVDLESIRIAFLCMLAPLVVVMSLGLIQVVISAITLATAYIKVTSDGIEQKHWPYRHVRCAWSEIDQIGKVHIFSDALFLKSYEKLGPMLSTKLPFNLFLPKQMFIDLTGYNGWSKGQLAEDLKRFAPHLFESQSESQASMSGTGDQDQPSGASHEERLLAALAHTGILFSPMGLIVPLVLWAAQGKKSAYIRIHALQALVWQVVMLGMYLLFSVCLFGVIVLPFWATVATGGESAYTMSPELFIGILASAFCFPLVSSIFLVYGLVGAVFAYQGKDFRYFVIGRWLEKRMG